MIGFLRIFTWLANVLVGGTGLVLFVMAWLMTTDDPYAIANHPLQPLFQHLHVFFSPLLVWNMGSVWVLHAWPYSKSGHRSGKRTGWVLIAMAAPMIFSGVGLQVSVSELARSIWSWTHVITSLLWVVAFLAHAVRHWREKSQRLG